MKRFGLLAVTFSVAFALMFACQGQAPGASVPDAYRNLENPLEGEADAASAGRIIYEDRCLACHGAAAAGEGPQSEGMVPEPADLVFAVDVHNDDYLFWRVADGGGKEPFNSSMPSFSSVLTEEQIWQVITYLHQLSE